jgi:hypothetical protein
VAVLRGIGRLIDGLSQGDARAVSVLIFAVVGTLLILAVTEIVQRRRRARRSSLGRYSPSGDPTRLRRSQE